MTKIKKVLLLLFTLLLLLSACTQASSDSNTSYQFVGSVNSNKYHYPDCEWAQKIKIDNEIWFTDAADARSQGYEPCKVCNPPN